MSFSDMSPRQSELQVRRALDRLTDFRGSELLPADRAAIASTAAELVALTGSFRSFAAASGLGECQQQIPYEPLRPVLRGDGLYWVCSHAPAHEIRVAP